MLKTRVLLIAASVVVIFIIFQLPKAVVENERAIGSDTTSDSIVSHIQQHAEAPKEVSASIKELRRIWSGNAQNEKNAIFADSLAGLYRKASRFDSAAWFAEEASKFFNNTESKVKAGDDYYQAYTLALDPSKQQSYAVKAQEFYKKVLEDEPGNLDVKTKMAMTYLSSKSPMQGITMLREVLAKDPKNQLALFNMGMLSIQSGQYDRAVERLSELISVNPSHIQGQLLLGIAWMNIGDKQKAREQFEKVKQMDKDPAVQATVDSYLKDLK
ncbi:tetratricopeptide repeat protein [Chryseosolibacter indicus]|uniref:Tetratricopeptide repeat protein n=1 Tax=Chryseosolibacter indicus TaxID=2782351 RepID=A0ABS5VNL3_9BACT|nr:tetratricopeptide repeat protein [Chryseosolibacter indicus]MBT1703050.1 tetratricopeptide repeat protein [Chryseosolibacter indicus]